MNDSVNDRVNDNVDDRVNDEDGSTWIRRFHPRPDAVTRLVCFPHAGGAASYFFPLSTSMPPAVEVVAVQYPGRQDRLLDPPVDDLGALADQVTNALRRWQDRPLVLFGHSMGATLAFEVGRRLERIGARPVGLFVSGRQAPSVPPREEFLHLKSDEVLLREINALSGTMSQLLDDAELMRMVLPVIRNDYKAVETYRYQEGPDVSCPVMALVGDADPRVEVGAARVWDRHTAGPFEIRIFPGGHFYLGDLWPAIATEVADHISAWRSAGTPDTAASLD